MQPGNGEQVGEAGIAHGRESGFGNRAARAGQTRESEWEQGRFPE
jgi:hypothetical protein